MSRAASRTLGLVTCAFALGCEPSAPPNAPPPPASAAAPSATPDAPPPPEAFSIKEGEPIPAARLPAFIEACAAGKLDDATAAALVQRLDAAHERSGEPCFVRVLKDYRQGVTDETVALAAKAVGELKLTGARAALFEAFQKVHASRPRAASVYRPVAQAMQDLPDPAWGLGLIDILNRPLDARDPATVTDEIYWQIVAARVLGLMQSSAAVKPLIKVVLSPAKGAGHGTALLALVRIGKPAIAPAIALLKGEDSALVEYSKQEHLKAADGDKLATQAAGTAHIGVAARILAAIGIEEATAPLLEVIARTDAISRAMIARELPRLPKTPATVKAFEDALEKTPPSAALPDTGGGAREALLEASTGFFDGGFVPWILQNAKTMKGDEGQLSMIRESSLLAAMKLATLDQWKPVEDLARRRAVGGGKDDTVGRNFTKELTLAKELLLACDKAVSCYLDKLADPAAQAADRQFISVKSAYMVGVLGSAADKSKLLAMMPKITNLPARFVAASLVDFWSPQGDRAAAALLRQLIVDAERSGDKEALQLAAPLSMVIYRLVARTP